MRLEEISEKYPILKDVIKRIKECDKIEELFPPQEEAIRKGVLDGKNMVLCTATGSGKTLIAELVALKHILEKGKKAIYLTPLRALAMEKFSEFTTKYSPLGIKIALSIGDMDSADVWIERYHLVCCTYEKADSLIRHGAPWLKDVSLLIIDEAHDINLVDRGPTLEIVITRLLKENPHIQIMGLSATIGNPEELAKWLNSELVVSNFRPVPLYEGVYYNNEINFHGKGKYKVLGEAVDPELKIVEDVLHRNGQALLFVNTRREAEATAKKACGVVEKFLSKSLKEELKKISERILNALPTPTKQCKELANCIKHGVAFHHAGLLNSQRKEIEDWYRRGVIKFIVATPTLIAGVNLPSQTVIIRNVRRYSSSIGYTVSWPVSLYKQAVGRAGRIKYDKEGWSVLIAKSEEEAEELTEHYIFGEPEEITSKLAVEPVLRMHVLALIATEFCKSKKSLVDFFSKTFFTFQYGNIAEIEGKLVEILNLLKKWKFIEVKKDKLIATRMGKRVSQLYIDPLTASIFIDSLKEAMRKEIEPFSFLQVICSVPEMEPLLSVRVGEASEIEEFIAKKEENFLQKVPSVEDWEFEEFMKTVKTALMFDAWINEASEDEILTKFKVAPGELRGRLEIADWLVYSLQELALLLGYKELLKHIRKLRIRLQHGVKEELIPLVKLRDIGRVRARILWNSNLRSLSDLRKIPYEKLSSIIGPKIAKSIKEQVEGKEVKEKKELQTTLKRVYF
jgi:helicase